MPDFNPAQVLPEEETETITTPMSQPNQFGGAVLGAPVDPVAQAAAEQAAQAQAADQVAAQSAFQHQASTAQVAANAPAAVVPIASPTSPPVNDNGTPVPPVAAVAPTSPVAPPPAPTAPAAPGATSAPHASSTNPGGISDAAQQTIDHAEREELNQEAQSNLAQQTDFKKDVAKGDADAANKAAALQLQQQKELDAAVARGNAYVQDAQDHVAQKTADYQKALDEDRSHNVFTGKSTWQKAGAWLGLALGAIGAGFSAAGGHPTGNLAVAQLNKLMDDDFQKQRAKIADLKDSVAIAQTGLRDAKDAKQALMYDLLAKQKAAYATLEAQAKANAAGLGVRAADLDGSSLMTSLKQKQLDTERAIDREAKTDYLTRIKTLADVRKSNAEASNADAMAQYHRALATGQVTPGGGVVNNIKIDQAAERVVKERLAADKELPKLLATEAEATAGLANVGPKANGFQVQGAVDSYIKAAAGGRATSAQLSNFKKRLGGLWDTIEGNLAQGVNGNYSPAQIKTVRDALQAAKDEAVAEKHAARKRHEDALNSSPIAKRSPETIKSALDERFGTDEPPTSAPATRTVVPKSGPYAGKTVTIDGANNILKVE